MRGAIVTLLFVTCTAGGQTETALKGHTGWVGAVAFSPDGKVLASAGADRVVHLWDVDKGEIVRTLRGHTNAIAALAFLGGGGHLASGGFDHTVKIWDLSQHDGAQDLPGHKGAVMALASTAEARLLSGSIDGSVRLWDLVTAKPLGIVTKHKSWVNAVALAKDGTLATGSSDNTVRLFAPKKEGWDQRIAHEFPAGEVRSLAFSPDAKHLAIGVRYGGLHIFDVGRDVRVAELKGHAADVWAVAFSPDGKQLASGDGDWDRPGEVYLWDTATWKKTASLKTSGEVLCLAFSPDSTRLAAGAWDKSLRVWRLEK